MNNRANIMYFIEHLCDMAQRENHPNYVRMIQQDILTVVDAVAPSDGSGAANVKVVRRVSPDTPTVIVRAILIVQVLASLQQKAILTPDRVTEIEACLQERDTLPAHLALSPIDPNNQQEHAPIQFPSSKNTNGVSRPDKRQIEQRIEEDRERHKRLRESIWAVGDDEDEEFERMWDEASEINEDDYLGAEEDAAERMQAVEFID